jgi:hypothetical protein
MPYVSMSVLDRKREIATSCYHCFFAYSLGPNIVDPILTFVLPDSIWKGKNICK